MKSAVSEFGKTFWTLKEEKRQFEIFAGFLVLLQIFQGQISKSNFLIYLNLSHRPTHFRSPLAKPSV